MSRNESIGGVFTFLSGGLLWNLQVLRVGLGEIHDALWYFPFSFEHWSLGSLGWCERNFGRVLELHHWPCTMAMGGTWTRILFLPLVSWDSAHVGEITPEQKWRVLRGNSENKVHEEYVAFGEDDFVGFWTCHPTKSMESAVWVPNATFSEDVCFRKYSRTHIFNKSWYFKQYRYYTYIGP